ncbi:MAG: MBL fold metallo-hydrolase [Desulfobacterales bacterium]|nr:MBL fold metallo-hydrolase [Desulfobacterales bacterium]
MILKTLIVGAFEVNNYLVADEKTKEAVLIDAGGDYKATKALINELGVKLKYLLNTHGHLDHVAGDYDIQKEENVKALMHKEDQFLVDKLQEHLKFYGMPNYETPKIDEYIEDGQVIELGELKIKVIHTPGHSPGAVCFLIDNVLFSGDTLFADSVGRTDLPGGSYEQLGQSIKNKLFVLDENIIVYPGHGPSTTIKHEKLNNPFFGESSKR